MYARVLKLESVLRLCCSSGCVRCVTGGSDQLSAGRGRGCCGQRVVGSWSTAPGQGDFKLVSGAQLGSGGEGEVEGGRVTLGPR